MKSCLNIHIEISILIILILNKKMRKRIFKFIPIQCLIPLDLFTISYDF